MLKIVLVMMHLLAPRRRYEDMRAVAESVVAACADNLAHARVLVTLHLMENGFNPRARYPYGLTGGLNPRLPAHPARPLAESARIALRSWRTSRRACGTDERAFRRYITGRCSPLPSDVGRYGDALQYVHTFARLGGRRLAF